MVHFTSTIVPLATDQGYLHIGVRLSIDNRGIYRTVFSRFYQPLTEVLGRRSYLGNCSFVFLHQLIHVFLIFLHT